MRHRVYLVPDGALSRDRQSLPTHRQRDVGRTDSMEGEGEVVVGVSRDERAGGGSARFTPPQAGRKSRGGEPIGGVQSEHLARVRGPSDESETARALRISVNIYYYSERSGLMDSSRMILDCSQLNSRLERERLAPDLNNDKKNNKLTREGRQHSSNPH